MNIIPIETHPLEPFMPMNAQVLMLGSFPPQKKRWCMEFYYPNFSNDMWRIMGIIFFANKEYFLTDTGKSFCKERIVEFAREKGIALFDTATEIRRLQENASDKFLEVIQPTDIKAMLRQLPTCKALVTTGQKATDTLLEQFDIVAPKVGGFTDFMFEGRLLKLFRMPTSSRAYPLKLEEKAAVYQGMFREVELV